MTSLSKKDEDDLSGVKNSAKPSQPQPQPQPQEQDKKEEKKEITNEPYEMNNSNNNKKKKLVSLLILGHTGVGKTTLVYAIRDFLKNKPFEEIQKTQQEEEEEAEGEEELQNEVEGFHKWEDGASRTLKPYSIIIRDHSDYDVVLIDTPGIGDTKGEGQDKTNWDSMATYIESSEFNAIVFAVDNGSNRLTRDFRYVVDELKKNFQSLVQERLIIVITRCNNNPSTQTVSAIKKLGLSIQCMFAVNNELYDEQVSLPTSDYWIVDKMDKENSNEENKKIYVQNQNKFLKLLEYASTFKRFQGNILTKYRIKRIECMSNLVKCNDHLKILEERIAELKTIKNELTQMDDIEAIKMLGSLKKKERMWIQIENKIQMYCLQCKNSCHESCKEVSTVIDDIHKCSYFSLTLNQILRKTIFELTGYVIEGAEILLGGIIAYSVTNSTILGTLLAFLGITIGGASGQEHKKILLEEADRVYLCTKCQHRPQDHVFLNRFPQDRVSKQSLQNRGDVKKVLQSSLEEEKELLQQKQNLEQELNLLGEYHPFMVSSSK